MAIAPFWIVFRLETPNPQRRYTVAAYKHDSPKKAFAEAERLANANPGATFVVMAAVGHRRAKARRVRVKTAGNA